MKISCFYIITFLLIFNYANAEWQDSLDKKYLHIKLLNLPDRQQLSYKPIKIAVVDMGFRLSHKALNDFVFVNENEIPNNYRDDDQNGYIDDLQGWDFADKDNNVTVPEFRKSDNYHGTYIAGIITKIFSEYFGDNAKEYLRVIPVKVYSDDSKRSEIQYGYEGIRYAADLGADIICCAWSGGKLRYEDKAHLDYAISKGCMIISAAGNYNTEATLPPGDYLGVYGICALDYNFNKAKKSNFSKIYELSAIGEEVYGPHSNADNAYFYDNGTSSAAAAIVACAGILKTISAKSTNDEIMTALKNTAIPIDSLNPTFSGKLGAGFPNMTKAIDFITKKDFKYKYSNSNLPKGNVLFKRGVSPNNIVIKPFGDYKGIHLIPLDYDKKGNITISTLMDSLIYKGSINGINRGLFIEDNGLKIQIDKQRTPLHFNFSYYMETIDSTVLYCAGDKYLFDDNGIINDGSGDNNYANNCVCKWIIKAPENKRIKIDFNYIGTEQNMDYVWIFEGNSTLPENILAKFSGNILPPSITSYTNEILVWFLTDDKTTGKGWELKYKFVD